MGEMTKCAMWCTGCGVRLSQDEIKGWGCPKCGCQGIPCHPDKDVFVEVNWHELHILCCWAERFAAQIAGAPGSDDDQVALDMPKTVSAIARRLEHQWPAFGALTLSGEIADMPEALEKAGIIAGPIETNVPVSAPVMSIGPGAVGFARPR